jgi:hypothetical protein
MGIKRVASDGYKTLKRIIRLYRVIESSPEGNFCICAWPLIWTAAEKSNEDEVEGRK